MGKILYNSYADIRREYYIFIAVTKEEMCNMIYPNAFNGNESGRF